MTVPRLPLSMEMNCVSVMVWIPVVTNRTGMCPMPQTDHAAHDIAQGDSASVRQIAQHPLHPPQHDPGSTGASKGDQHLPILDNIPRGLCDGEIRWLLHCTARTVKTGSVEKNTY